MTCDTPSPDTSESDNIINMIFLNVDLYWTRHWLTDDSHDHDDALWNRLGDRGGGDAVTDRIGVL